MELDENSSDSEDSDDECFVKNQDAINDGKDYEITTIAYLALILALDDTIEKFKISADVGNYGAFDDIVIEKLSTEGKREILAFQLKHQTNCKNLKTDHLIGCSGHFSLVKYSKSVESLECDDKLRLILLTNRTLPIESDGSQLLLQEEKNGINCNIPVTIKHMTTDIDCVLPKTDVCYRISVDENNSNTNMCKKLLQYKGFFKQFYLLTNQPNLKTLESQAEKLYCDSFTQSKELFLNYLHYIQVWSKKKKKNFLTKKCIEQFITLQIVTPYIITPTETTFIDNDKFAIIEELQQRFKTLEVSNSRDFYFENIWKNFEQVFEQNKKKVYNTVAKYQMDLSQNGGKINRMIQLKIWWILNNDSLPLVYHEDIKPVLLKLCKRKKFLVFSDQNLQHVDGLSTFRNLSDLKNNRRLLNKILSSFSCKLQGRHIILKDLIKDYPELFDLITANDIFSMARSSFTIGEAIEKLPAAHIDRSLTKNVVKLDFLDKLPEDEIVIIGQILPFQNYTKLGLEDKQVTCIDKKERQNITKMFPNNKWHYFEVTLEEELEWICSTGCVINLKKHQDIKFSIKEEELEHVNNEIILIIGEPGMGKSTLFKHLKNYYLPNHWKVLLTAQRLKEFITTSCTMLIEDFIKEKYSDMEAKVFDNLYKKRKIVFFHDGVDELFGENLKAVLTLVKTLSNLGFKQFVCSRPYLADRLERELNVLARSLQPLTKLEQKNYIEKRLPDCNKKIIEHILDYLKLVQYNSICGIPLQIAMLVDLIQEDQAKYEQSLENLFLVTNLYRYSIDEKLNIYCKRQGKTTEIYYKQYLLQDFQKASLKLFFEDSLDWMFIEESNAFLDKLSEENFINGIIISMTNDKKPAFLHQSLAEYLTATFLVKTRQTFPHLCNIIFQENFRNVRFMFDVLMAEGSFAHLAVLYKNVELLVKYESQINCVDCGGRTPLHLGCSWGERYPLLPTDQSGKWLTIENTHGDTVNPESENNKRIFDILFEKCDFNVKDKLFGMNALEYADRSFCLYPINRIACKTQVNISQLKNFSEMGTVLYYSSKFKYDYLLKTLKNIPFFETRNSDSFFHVLAEYNNTHFLRNLMNLRRENIFQNVLNPNSTDRNGRTPLHVACKKGFDEIVEIILECTLNIDAVDNKGRTALYYASQGGFEQIVKLLVNAKAKVGLTDKEDLTAICAASSMGHIDIVKYLLPLSKLAPESSACTPLHCASRKGHINIAKFLLKQNEEVDYQNNGYTALYLASQNGHFNLVKLLTRYKANLNTVVTENGYSPLFVATEKGYYNIVELLLQQNAQAKSTDNCQNYLIHIASKNGHCEIVEFLLRQQINEVNCRNNEDNLPIHLACLEGHINVLQVLFSYNTQVDICNKNGHTPLYLGSQNGHDIVVRYLLDHSADATQGNNLPIFIASSLGHVKVVETLIRFLGDSKFINQNSERPIHVASSNGHCEVIRLLLSHSVDDIDELQKDFYTPVYLASQNGHYEAVAELLKYKCNFSIADKYGYTPLHVATRGNHPKVLQLLLEHEASVNARDKEGYTALYFASFRGYYDIAKILLFNQADVNIPNNDGYSPLHVASQKGYTNVVELLIKNKAEINVPSKDHYTAVYLATRNSHEEVIKLLLQHQADVNISTKDQTLPLHIACQNGMYNIVEAILPKTNNIDLQQHEGFTSIYSASLNGHHKVVQLLISYKANANIAEKDGRTPLYAASFRGQYKVAKLLVEEGVDLETCNKEGYSSLHVSSQNGNYDVVDLLLNHGANVNVTHVNNGVTPLYLACQNGHVDVVHLLMEKNADKSIKAKNNLSPLDVAKRKKHDTIVLYLDNFINT